MILWESVLLCILHVLRPGVDFSELGRLFHTRSRFSEVSFTKFKLWHATQIYKKSTRHIDTCTVFSSSNFQRHSWETQIKKSSSTVEKRARLWNLTSILWSGVWCRLNWCLTGHGIFRANKFWMCLIASPACECGAAHIISECIVQSCSV